jgi:hypothetical protein
MSGEKFRSVSGATSTRITRKKRPAKSRITAMIAEREESWFEFIY